MPFVLFLLGAAAVALVASQSHASESKGGGRTYTLDKNLPPQLRAQVLAALQSERDPSKLLAFASQLATSGYPLAAAALTQRAAQLGAPPLPQPQPQPTPQPQPGVNPIDPGMLPDPPRTQVLAALGTGTDPDALEALAKQMDALGFTFAAQALRTKETALRGMQPQPGPVAPSPGPSPVPSPFSLDPGMPPAMQSAVLGALTTETDPAKLQAFAQEIQAQYPIAAGLLMTKALALRGSPVAPPLPGPQPGPGPSPSPHPSPGVLNLPVGDDSTRTGRNAGRPTGYPFIHLRGESTYPAKIAKQATGNEMNYPQMSKLNPQFSRDGVHWINIQRGDALNIPWDWAPKLAGAYLIKVDPGVAPPAGDSSSVAMARRPPSPAGALATRGGPHGVTSHA